MMNRNTREHFTGCLRGGAVGDTLGWPVEFADLKEITQKYGPEGISFGKDYFEAKKDPYPFIITFLVKVMVKVRGL